MPKRKQSLAFRIYVQVVLGAWVAVIIAALWGLDWRWIPTALAVAVALLIGGGLVENHLHERAQRREFARQLDEAKRKPARWLRPLTDEEREAHRAVIAAEEEAWLGNTDQPR